jgi:membrane associated rhomboid family serine protease
VANRQFQDAVEFYEQVYDWCTLSSVTLARLLAARAYAETGDVQRALRCLHFVALSPRTVGPLESQLWAARISVAALAGDAEELERLRQAREYKPRIFRRHAARFVAYWRGRCALVRGEQAEAVKQLTRAYALTHPRNKPWRDAIMQYLQQAEVLSSPPTTIPAQSPAYTIAQQGLRYSEQQTAAWRALMYMGRPAPVTLTLLLVFLIVYLVDAIVFSGRLNRPLWEWAGNIPEAIRHGDWWRPITAQFLHANWLHLGMNGLALWLFGSAVEKTMGRWRFLVIFMVAGSLGNFMSAWRSHYDVSIGASGGVFGVIGAFGVAAYHLNVPIYTDVRRRLLMLIILMVAADLTISGLEPQVDNLAHVGGLGVGVLLALLLRRRQSVLT